MFYDQYSCGFKVILNLNETYNTHRKDMYNNIDVDIERISANNLL